MTNDLEHRTNLERRRRAIADALRAIMAEPLPTRHTATPDPAIAVPAPVAVPRQAAAESADVVSGHDEHAALAAEDRFVTDEPHDEHFTELPDSLLPPLETIGSMSRRASLALFGHA
jgi:hypothetical protein